MIAQVVVLVPAGELEKPDSAAEARVRARNALSRLGIPNEGAVTPSLLGDEYRCEFTVDGITP